MTVHEPGEGDTSFLEGPQDIWGGGIWITEELEASSERQ